MLDRAASIRANIMPALQYRDARAAIDFLCNAFGFERKMVVPGENDTIAHAELVLGNAMVMLGSTNDGPFGRLMKTPHAAGGVTAGIYVVVPDADAHHAQARKAGAEIVIGLVTQDYGGRDYTARDPEGHVWTFGTYDPWKG